VIPSSRFASLVVVTALACGFATASQGSGTEPVPASGAGAGARLPGSPALGDPRLRTRYVEGLGGVPLNVVEAGDPRHRTLIFIHGLGQSHLSWAPQLQSALATEFHLVAYDLRGHGNSGKPWRSEDYAAPATWAGDLERVIRATGARRPLLVSWSYGTWVAIDYLEVHPATGIAGLVMIGALGGLAPMIPPAGPAQTARGKGISERTRSGWLDDNFEAGDEIARFFMRREADATWTRRTAAANALLSPYVRPLISQRSFDHTREIPRVTVPTWLVLGSEDPQAGPASATPLVGRLPDVSLSVFDGSGHLPFAEDPVRFNRELAAFARRAFDKE
jgi:pimeloyl-ACP methyl ester carboxylesterase